MQVSDLTFRLKLLCIGFLSPVFLLLGGILSAPYWLLSSDPYQKSDLAIFEINHKIPTKKQLKQIVTQYQKGDFKKLILVQREEKESKDLFSLEEKKIRTINALTSSGFPVTQVESLSFPLSKMGDTESASKIILKQVVAENAKTVLVFCKAWESKRTLGIYKKTLASLPVVVSVSSFPSEFQSGDWFSTEDGFRELTDELIRYLYSYFRGVL